MEYTENICYKYHKTTLLYGIVLENVKVVAKAVDSGKLMDSLSKKLSKQKKTDKLEAEKSKIITRLTQLTKITKKLYEDNASGYWTQTVTGHSSMNTNKNKSSSHSGFRKLKPNYTKRMNIPKTFGG